MNTNNEIEYERSQFKDKFPFLFNLERKNPFSTPCFYFTDTEQSISLLLSTNASFDCNNFVPHNYFDELEDNIKTRLTLQDYKNQSFSIPENYFELSPTQIKTSVYLLDIKGNDVFDIPENYFESLAVKTASKLRLEETKTSALNIFAIYSKAKYLSAAAALIGICLLSYFVFNSKALGNANCIQLTALDKTNIVNNPSDYGIDESVIIELFNGNTDLASAVDVVEASDIVNELVSDQTIDFNDIILQD